MLLPEKFPARVELNKINKTPREQSVFAKRKKIKPCLSGLWVCLALGLAWLPSRPVPSPQEQPCQADRKAGRPFGSRPLRPETSLCRAVLTSTPNAGTTDSSWCTQQNRTEQHTATAREERCCVTYLPPDLPSPLFDQTKQGRQGRAGHTRHDTHAAKPRGGCCSSCGVSRGWLPKTKPQKCPTPSLVVTPYKYTLVVAIAGRYSATAMVVLPDAAYRVMVMVMVMVMAVGTDAKVRYGDG